MPICKLCNKNYNDYQGRNRMRCGSCNTKIRRFRTKLAAINFLGGKCQKCGWEGDQAAFQFHHNNPKEKDFGIGNVANKKWEFISKELKKCSLLCANCHSILHSTKNNTRLIEEAKNYRGKNIQF